MSSDRANTEAGAVTSVIPVHVDGPSEIALHARSDSLTRTIPINFVLTAAAPNNNLRLREHTVFLAYFALFESVELLSATFTVYMTADTSHVVEWGISGTLATGTSILTAPISGLIGGSDSGMVTSVISLPAQHPFGKELKALNLGNPDPVFHFHGLGATGTTRICQVLGSISVRASGHGIIPAIN
jgi:hypothetical protein